MREGQYAVIFKPKPGTSPNRFRAKAGGAWMFSGCTPGRRPSLMPLGTALAKAEREARSYPGLIYDVKRMT